MKKLILTLVLAVCSLQVGFSQDIDQKTLNIFAVKLRNMESLYNEGKFYEVIEKAKEIEDLVAGFESAKSQNFKVKAYIGLEMYERAKKELEKLYTMSYDEEVLADIASYASKIDEGIAEEKARKERARLAEIERKEQARLAEIRRVEEAKQAEIKRKEDERIAIANRLERERKLLEEKEWAEAVEKARFEEMVKDIRELYRIWYKDKYGFIDKDNKVVIPIKYDFVGVFRINQLCIVKINEKWGAINVKGEVVIPIVYDGVSSFRMDNSFDHFMIVEKNGASGVIDTDNNNKIVIPFNYDNLSPMMEYNLLEATKNNKKGVINRTGKEIIPIKYDLIEQSNGKLIATLKEKNETVYYNYNGEIIQIQNEEYDWQGEYNFGYAIIKKNEKYGIVDKSGSIKVPITYEEIEYLDKGLYKVWILNSENNKYYGAINGIGEIVLPFEYSHIGSFKYGWTNFCKKNGCGFIDVNGKVIGEGNYYSVREPENDKAVASTMINKNKKFGLIDNHGEVIIPFMFENIWAIKQDFDFKGEFRNYFLVKKDDNYGIFDRFGKSITKIKYDNIKEVTDGSWYDRYQPIYFIVTKNKLKGVYDGNGKMIIPIKYSKIELERGQYLVDFSQFYLYDKNDKLVNKFDLEYDKNALEQKKFIIIDK